MFEIHVGELRATFLRNHNMRRHKDPSRRQPKPKTPQAEDTPSPEDNPSGRHPKPGRQPKRKTPQAEDTPSPEDNPSGRHPKRKTTQAQKTPATPTTATSAGAVHPLRGGAPEQKRCIAYGSGALPQRTRTNAELAHQTTHRHTPPCAPGPYWRQDGHTAHATTCTPAHSDPLRHLLHPYMRRAGKDAERAGARRRREKRSARPGAGQGSASGRWPTGRRSDRTRPR